MASPFECILQKMRAGTATPTLMGQLQNIIENLDDTDELTRAFKARDILQYRLNKKKQKAALQAVKMKEFEDEVAVVEALPDQEFVVIPKVAKVSKTTLMMLSKLTYDPTGNFVGSNVEINWKIIRAKAEALFSEGLERFHRKKLGFVQDKAGLRKLVREIYGEATEDLSAYAISKSWKRVDDYLVRRMQKAGGNVFKREDWGLPQIHDSKRVGAVPFEEWFEYVAPRLNRAKMIDDTTGKPFSNKAFPEVMRDVYETIRSDGLANYTPGKIRTGNSITDSHRNSRFIVFKDADSWLDYNEKFGTGGDIFEILTGHMDQMSREISILEVLGPDPDATIRWMTDKIRINNVESLQKKKVGSIRDTAGPRVVEQLYDVMTGKMNSPVTAWWAEANQFTRNILTSAQLGGAFISAMTDLNFARMTSSFNGLKRVRQNQQFLKNFFSNATGGEQQRLATRLLLGAEQWAGTAIGQQRFLGEVTGPKTSKLISDTVLRASLLTPWTYSGRHAFKQEVLLSIADNMEKAYTNLDPVFLRGLQRYGVDAKDWEKIRKPQNFVNENGQVYFDPRETARNGFSDEAEKVLRFAFTEAEYAVPSASGLTRLATTGGLQAGTFYGEMVRNVGLYKSFPITVLLTHLMRGTVYAGMMPATRMRYMLDLIISTTVFGATALQMKQIVAGKEPVDVFDQEYTPQFLAAAMLQGGGLGIFGDFLFADQNRFGYGPLQTMAGPVLGSFVPDTMKLTLGNAQELLYQEDTKIGRDTTKYLRKYTPGSSIWYTKLGVERLLFERLQDLVDPGANRSFRRRIQKARTDYGQGWWWAPGTTEPNLEKLF